MRIDNKKYSYLGDAEQIQLADNYYLEMELKSKPYT